ncbi:hypothetical protein Tco_1140026 [Tanacetum coccineum]
MMILSLRKNHALKLTPFYNAFDVSADVPEIYMQEFCHSDVDDDDEAGIHDVNDDNDYDDNNDEMMTMLINQDNNEIQGANVKGEEMDEEETNEEDEANELYRDVNINLEGRDTEMTDAPRTIVQTTQVIEDTHSTSLIDVPVTTIVDPPLLSTTTLPPPPTPLITHLEQTPIPTLATALSSSLQDLSDFGSLFGYLHSWLVDAYPCQQIYGSCQIAVQFTSQSLRDEAQAENYVLDGSAQAEEPTQTTKYLGEPTHQEFETGVTEDQPVAENSYFPDLFQKPDKLPSPDYDWNKT